MKDYTGSSWCRYDDGRCRVVQCTYPDEVLEDGRLFLYTKEPPRHAVALRCATAERDISRLVATGIADKCSRTASHATPRGRLKLPAVPSLERALPSGSTAVTCLQAAAGTHDARECSSRASANKVGNWSAAAATGAAIPEISARNLFCIMCKKRQRISRKAVPEDFVCGACSDPSHQLHSTPSLPHIGDFSFFLPRVYTQAESSPRTASLETDRSGNSFLKYCLSLPEFTRGITPHAILNFSEICILLAPGRPTPWVHIGVP